MVLARSSERLEFLFTDRDKTWVVATAHGGCFSVGRAPRSIDLHRRLIFDVNRPNMSIRLPC
jgi:hypothetical protein